jgi:hypothetical protein
VLVAIVSVGLRALNSTTSEWVLVVGRVLYISLRDSGTTSACRHRFRGFFVRFSVAWRTIQLEKRLECKGHKNRESQYCIIQRLVSKELKVIRVEVFIEWPFGSEHQYSGSPDSISKLLT